MRIFFQRAKIRPLRRRRRSVWHSLATVGKYRRSGSPPHPLFRCGRRCGGVCAARGESYRVPMPIWMRRWVAEEEENKKKKGRCRSTPAYRPRGSQKGKIENLFLALSMDVDLFIEESATTPPKEKKRKKNSRLGPFSGANRWASSWAGVIISIRLVAQSSRVCYLIFLANVPVPFSSLGDGEGVRAGPVDSHLKLVSQQSESRRDHTSKSRSIVPRSHRSVVHCIYIYTYTTHFSPLEDPLIEPAKPSGAKLSWVSALSLSLSKCFHAGMYTTNGLRAWKQKNSEQPESISRRRQRKTGRRS